MENDDDLGELVLEGDDDLVDFDLIVILLTKVGLASGPTTLNFLVPPLYMDSWTPVKGRRSLANASVLSTNRGAYTCRCPSLGLARETVARGHARPYISAFVTSLRMRKAIFSISRLLSFALCRLHY